MAKRASDEWALRIQLEKEEALVAELKAPRERPILFSAPMVRAILDGRKGQTRRLVKWKPREEGINVSFSGLDLGFYCTGVPSSGYVLRSRGSGGWNDRTWPAHCAYGAPGGRLWVRETWRPIGPLSECTGPEHIRFAASASEAEWAVNKWKPSIFMPRWASRITLEVTAVRVERLQAISDADARAEGCAEGEIPADEYGPRRIGWAPGADDGKCVLYPSARDAYRVLWDSINGERANWASNPWVWVIEFRRVI